jgi:hypothetical protein
MRSVYYTSCFLPYARGAQQYSWRCVLRPRHTSDMGHSGGCMRGCSALSHCLSVCVRLMSGNRVDAPLVDKLLAPVPATLPVAPPLPRVLVRLARTRRPPPDVSASWENSSSSDAAASYAGSRTSGSPTPSIRGGGDDCFAVDRMRMPMLDGEMVVDPELCGAPNTAR